jgi:hypothetical protein
VEKCVVAVLKFDFVDTIRIDKQYTVLWKGVKCIECIEQREVYIGINLQGCHPYSFATMRSPMSFSLSRRCCRLCRWFSLASSSRRCGGDYLCTSYFSYPLQIWAPQYAQCLGILAQELGYAQSKHSEHHFSLNPRCFGLRCCATNCIV